MIDPYLSNTLEAKYAQTPYSHKRMAPSARHPRRARRCRPRSLHASSHRPHGPGNTRPLARRLPNLRFVVPTASAALARQRAEVGDIRLIPVDAGAKIEPAPGVELCALQAAHETMERDEGGHCRFLGFAVASDRTSIFHSGDCVPYVGQVEELARTAPDLAPPAGERTFEEPLRRAGFAGNFRVEEALALCRRRALPNRPSLRHVRVQHGGSRAIDRTLAAAPIRMRFGRECKWSGL